jgi:integrase
MSAPGNSRTATAPGIHRPTEKISPHDLRHTCASLAVSAGANVLAVARMLGHKDASVTLRVYSDLFDTDLDTLADVMDTVYAGKCGQNAATEVSRSQ